MRTNITAGFISIEKIDPDFEELHAKIAAHREKNGVLLDGRFSDGRQPGIAEQILNGLTATPG